MYDNYSDDCKNLFKIEGCKSMDSFIKDHGQGIIKTKSVLIMDNIFLCAKIFSANLKTTKRYHCGIQVEGPHLTLGAPPFTHNSGFTPGYSGFYPLYLC